jgi:hypothetical protein
MCDRIPDIAVHPVSSLYVQLKKYVAALTV